MKCGLLGLIVRVMVRAVHVRRVRARARVRVSWNKVRSKKEKAQ
jgi:hypothetical protein